MRNAGYVIESLEDGGKENGESNYCCGRIDFANRLRRELVSRGHADGQTPRGSAIRVDR